MLTQKENRTCILCSRALKGRSDKKFCDDYCRAAYNNELKGVANNFMRNVNHALGKNRRILERLLPESEQTGKTNRDNLLQLGFQFRYITHTYTNQKGNVYFFCYEYGYLPLENNRYLLVKRNEE
jgi:predicted nucleic acid-binding Zn ribbon protein